MQIKEIDNNGKKKMKKQEINNKVKKGSKQK